MLYKNRKEFQIPEEHKAELKKLFPRFPVVLKYHPSRVKYDANNKVQKAPEVLAIPTTSSASVFDQVEQFTYAVNAYVNDKAVLVTTPRSIEVFRSLMIKEKDLDLLWYLYYVAPRIGNNNLKSSVPYFIFEDKAKDAAIQEEKVKKEMKLKNLIFDDERGLSVENLKEIAKTYDIDPLNLSVPEIRIQLEKRIGLDDLKYNEFMAKVKSLENSSSGVLVENIVREAIEKEYIIYDKNKFTYHFTDPTKEGGFGSILTSMTAVKAVNAESKLIGILSEQKELLEVLQKEMQHRKETEEAPI